MNKPEEKSNLFEAYQQRPEFYDEMFSTNKTPHSFTKEFVKSFNNFPLQDIRSIDKLTSRFFLNEGITFNIYDDKKGGVQRTFPMDIIPRVMSSEEWNFIEKGLSQRMRALNLFLKDIYSEEKILKDGLIPKDLIYESPHFLKEMKNSPVPFDVYVHLLWDRYCTNKSRSVCS